MNKHEKIQLRLVYNHLAVSERQVLEAHVNECAACRAGVEILQHERRLVASIPRDVPRPGLANDLRVVALREPRRADARRSRRLGLSGLAVAMLAVVAILAAALSPGGRTAPAAAQALLQQAVGPAPYVAPSQGDAYISYRRLDWTEVPVNAAPSLSPHLIHVRWAIRGATRFRVDITTIRPYVDAGTLTVVARRRTIRTFNSATRIATVQTLPVQGLQRRLEAYLVELRFGFGCCVSIPDPIHSLSGYLSRLNSGPVGAAQVHITGHQQVHGRRTTVVDLHPAVRASDISPCYLTPGPGGTFPQPSSCRQYTKGFGWARLWIDSTRHTVLRYQEFGFPSVQNPIAQPSNYLFRVHSVTFGAPPEHLLHVPQWPRGTRLAPTDLQAPLQVLGGNSKFTIPRAFVRTPFPAFLADAPGQQGYGEVGIPRRLGIDVVWRHVTRETDYRLFPRKDVPPDSTWLHGPYLLMQQRLRPSGLPAYYRSGTQTRIGRCTVWSGTYSGHGLWAATVRPPLTIVLSSGGLSSHVLDAYVRSLSICREST